ncbi:MAG: GNAT family N-acetyltransferase [Symbiobacteriia bacterium]
MNVRAVEVGRRRYLGLLLLADPSETAILSYLNRGHLLVAELNGRTIGVAHLDPLPDGGVELRNLAMVEDLQGQGYGKALMREVVAFCRQRGYGRIRVGTGNSSLGNLAFYQKLGFRLVGVQRDYFLSYPMPIYENGLRCLDLVQLELSLAPTTK